MEGEFQPSGGKRAGAKNESLSLIECGQIPRAAGMETKTFDLNSPEFSKFRAVRGAELVIVVLATDREHPTCCVTHEHDQVWIVLNGEMEIDEKGEVKVLTQGEGALVPRDTPHTATFRVGCRVLHILVPQEIEILAGEEAKTVH